MLFGVSQTRFVGRIIKLVRFVVGQHVFVSLCICSFVKGFHAAVFFLFSARKSLDIGEKPRKHGK